MGVMKRRECTLKHVEAHVGRTCCHAMERSCQWLMSTPAHTHEPSGATRTKQMELTQAWLLCALVCDSDHTTAPEVIDFGDLDGHFNSVDVNVPSGDYVMVRGSVCTHRTLCDAYRPLQSKGVAACVTRMHWQASGRVTEPFVWHVCACSILSPWTAAAVF